MLQRIEVKDCNNNTAPRAVGSRVRKSDCKDAYEVDEADIFLNGKKVAAVRRMSRASASTLRPALQRVKYSSAPRLGGAKGGLNSTFGFQPSNGIFRSFCGACGMLRRQRKEFLALCSQAEEASNFLKTHFPENYSAAESWLAEHVLPDWVVPNSVFTGGIANKNNQVPYHYDRANTPGSVAVMASFRDAGVRGGWLCFPQYNLRLLLADATWIAFPNTEWMHGVSPIQRKGASSRYSAVYFTNQRMSACGSPSDELQKARSAKMKTAKKRAGLKNKGQQKEGKSG